MVAKRGQSQISGIQLGALRSFLRSRGYVYREPWGRYLQRFSKKKGGREDNVLVPTQRDISDFERRLIEAFDSLSRQLEISSEIILREVINSAYEVVRIRVNEDGHESTIPYDTSIDLLRGGFALIDSAAVSAISHETLSIIRGRRPDIVRRYLDDVRVGQTEVGSFVLTLLMPTGIDANDLDLPTKVSDSFGARVSETFSSTLQAAEEAVRGNGLQSNRALIQSGITANFSGAVARIVEAAGDVSISLAGAGTSQVATKRVVSKFLATDSETLRNIEDRLTPRGGAEPFTITGTITEFREPRGKSSGSIVVTCDVHGETRQVRTKFDRANRQIIIQALERKSEVYVEVDGDLVSKSGHFQLDNPSGFRTVRRGPLA